MIYGLKDSMVRSEGKYSVSSYEINLLKYVELLNYIKVEFGEYYVRFRFKKLKVNIEYIILIGYIYWIDYKGCIKEVYVDNFFLKDGGCNNYV